MKYIQQSVLASLYRNSTHPVHEDYAELRLIRAACSGQADEACSLFREEKLFGHVPCVIDTPYARYEGLSGVRRFVEEWLPRFGATDAEVIPVIQTRANGRSVTELQVDFSSPEGIRQVPFFVVADLRTQDTLDEVRLYTHCSFIPGLQAYRAPLFLMQCMSEKCVFGGYEPLVPGREPATTREEVREKYEHMALYIPRCVAMRYETLTDDGRTCVIEWVHVISRAGREERGRIAMSGIAAYERGDDGLLCSIRISDYAGLERTIDWSQLPVSKEEAEQVNFVEEYR